MDQAAATTADPIESAEKSTAPDRHRWIGTESLKTRYGTFEFVKGYPTAKTTGALFEQLRFNRAVEVYLAQLPAVDVIETRRGAREFGASRSNQIVVWEQLMDAATLVLTANAETVYALGFLDLKADGPTVVEAPPMMLGAAMDMLQRFLADIGPLGQDKGKGGKYLFLPPGFDGDVPDGYFVVRSPTYAVSYFLRGFQENGTTDHAVQLIKQAKIYPLAAAGNPPAMEFLNGSTKSIDTILTDTSAFFDSLAQIVNEEPAEIFTPLERFYMQVIGIEHGKPFAPDATTRTLLADAARVGAAMARANSYGSPTPDTRYYADRQWEFVGDVPYTFVKDGIAQVDRRASTYYIAIGNSPAMIEQNVGVGSYYLWTFKDESGAFLDGAQSYRLHIPPNVPAKNFWSVVVYDARSRSELQNGQRFPSVSGYTDPVINKDGSVDVYFGPNPPAAGEKNWIKTVPTTGWFPIFRFYGPQKPLYDKSWKLSDVERLEG